MTSKEHFHRANLLADSVKHGRMPLFAYHQKLLILSHLLSALKKA